MASTLQGMSMRVSHSEQQGAPVATAASVEAVALTRIPFVVARTSPGRIPNGMAAQPLKLFRHLEDSAMWVLSSMLGRTVDAITGALLKRTAIRAAVC
jgi:hypothetical protein